MNKKLETLFLAVIIVIQVLVLKSGSAIAGWEYQNPIPSPERLNAVWGSSETDIFAVGGEPYERGIIVHYDGNTWSTMTTPLVMGLHAVWGSSSTDVFAVGEYSTILHYDGTSWSFMINPEEDFFYDSTLTGIWGTSGDNVYAVGTSGLILHYDGSEWHEMEVDQGPFWRDLHGIWGSSPNDIYAVG